MCSPGRAHVRRDSCPAQEPILATAALQNDTPKTTTAAPWECRRRADPEGTLLRRLEVHGRRPAALGGNLVGDFLALVQAVHSRALDGADMDEHILAAVGRLDESETLGGVEPLHGACGHYPVSSASGREHAQKRADGALAASICDKFWKCEESSSGKVRTPLRPKPAREGR